MIVVFEGIPGSGKTSTIEILQQKLVEQGFACTISNFQESASIVKKLVEKAKNYQFGQPNRNFLFWLSILHHIIDLKEKAQMLNEKEIILTEDCWGSLLAYAEWSFVGFGKDDPFWDEYLKSLNFHPLTFFLDTPVRIAQSRSPWAKLQDSDNARQLRVRYQELAKKFGWTSINGACLIENRAKKCMNLILGDERK
jgi:thymidylate kinase